MFHLAVLSSLLVFVQSIAIPKPIPDDRIVGGSLIDISRVPYQVSLQDGWHWHFCGGTLVAPSIIISAAHCTIDKTSKDVSVRVGSNSTAEGGQLIPVSTIINHPEYHPISLDCDISILVLSKPQTYTWNFPALPAADSLIQDGAWAMASGWGETKNSQQSNERLRAANVPIVNQAECRKMHGGFITSQMLCAGDSKTGGVGVCNGDSGGPLTLNGYLVGVVSWSVGCADVGYPGVYAMVSSLRQWIKDAVDL